jgi:hypothetical protein
MRESIARLPQRERVAIVLHHMIGLSVAETAGAGDYEVARARKQPVAPARIKHRWPRRHQIGAGVVLAVSAIAILVVLRTPRFPMSVGGSSGPSLTPGRLAGPTPTAQATMAHGETSTPTAVPGTAGPIVAGIPASFGGVPVLRGGELEAWISANTDATPALAGGWFREDHLIIYCPIPQVPAPVESCGSFPLYEDAWDGDRLWIAPGDEGLLPDRLYEKATRPVVLLIHTHDARCPADDESCERRPVLLEVIWLGEPIESQG